MSRVVLITMGESSVFQPYVNALQSSGANFWQLWNVLNDITTTNHIVVCVPASKAIVRPIPRDLPDQVNTQYINV